MEPFVQINGFIVFDVGKLICLKNLVYTGRDELRRLVLNNDRMHQLIIENIERNIED
jgi:hypothetical protein